MPPLRTSLLGSGVLKRLVAAATGPDRELPQAEDGVGVAGGVLEAEPFVDVVAADEDGLGAVVVERLPERLVDRVGPVDRGRAEARVVPEGHGAFGVAGGEGGPQPLLLGEPGAHPPTLSQLLLRTMTCQAPTVVA